MKLYRRLLALFISLTFFSIGAFASHFYPNLCYQQDASSLTVNPEFKTLPITEWIGERFVSLGRDPSLQHYGYQLIYPANRTIGTLPFNEYVGKIVKITDVTPSSTRVSGSYTVEMIVEETGERLRAMAVSSNVSGLGPMADIERARALYVGKTLWREAGSLQTFDERSRKVAFVDVEPFEPLKVTAVTAGWDNEAPVRFVVRTPSGIEGYVDVSMSGTNISSILRNSHRFESEFRLTAPARESADEAARSYKPSVEALARAAQGKDVLGWQQGWWGMTTDELMKTFGDSLQKLPKRSIYKGMYADYVIPNYKVDRDIYTVIFQIDNRTHRLAQVLIRSEEFPKDSQNLSAFDRLEALLSQKYGPVRYKQDENETFVKRERQWVFPTTTIELSYLFMRGISNGVTIRYYPTASSDANKL